MNELGFAWIDIGILLLKILAVIVVNLVILMIMEWAERRVSAFIQDRLGPNRVGPAGLFQAVADGIKFFFKERSQRNVYGVEPAHFIKTVQKNTGKPLPGVVAGYLINIKQNGFQVPLFHLIAEIANLR